MQKDTPFYRLPADVWDEITITFSIGEIGALRLLCKDFYFPLTEVWDRRLLKHWELSAVHSNINSYWDSSYIIFRTRDGSLFAHAKDARCVGLEDTRDPLVRMNLPPALDVFCTEDAAWVRCVNQEAYQLKGRYFIDECDRYISYNGPFSKHPLLNVLYRTDTDFLTQEATVFREYPRDGCIRIFDNVKAMQKYNDKLLLLTRLGEVFFETEEQGFVRRVKIEGLQPVSNLIADLEFAFLQRDNHLSLLESVSPCRETLLCEMRDLQLVMLIKNTVYYLTNKGEVFAQPRDASTKPERRAVRVRQLIRDGHNANKLYMLYYSGNLVEVLGAAESPVAKNVCRVIAEKHSDAGYGIRTNVIESNDGSLSFLGQYPYTRKDFRGLPHYADFRDMQKSAIGFFQKRRSESCDLIRNRKLIQAPNDNKQSEQDLRIKLYADFAMKVMGVDKHPLNTLRKDFVGVFEMMKPAMTKYQTTHHGTSEPRISWFKIGQQMVECYKNNVALDVNAIENDILFLMNNHDVEMISPGQAIASFIQSLLILERNEVYAASPSMSPI